VHHAALVNRFPRDLDDPITPLPSVDPALMGVLAPGVGEKVLMHLFAEGVSGRLLVEGVAPQNGVPRGQSGAFAAPRAFVFFMRGEPVHVEPLEGALAFADKLDEYKGIPRVATVRGTVSALARSGVPPLRILAALRDLNRDFTRALLACESGRFELYVEDRPLDDVPLVAVNPFGLVLEARRRSVDPAALHSAGEELANAYLAPRNGLASITPRIRSFTGGVDIVRLVDGTRTVADLYEAMGLPPSIGGLVVHTLKRAGVVDVLHSARATPRRDTWVGTATTLPLTLSDDALPLSELQRLPPEGLGLLRTYLELKPTRSPVEMFGNDVDKNPAALERAWEERLAQLDPRLIAEGRARPYLLARVEELRGKFERAYRLLASTTPRRGTNAFDLFERIGAGGMAEVYRAKSAEDGRVVAVKRIRAENRNDPDFVRDLLHEARLAKRIRHPNVVRVLTVGKSGDEVYLAMELVDGADLGALLKNAKTQKRTIPLDVILRIIADACGGLQAAHAARDEAGKPEPILHRDVSPQNILVGVDGRAKLTDFGVARTIDPDEVQAKGPLKGKLPYLSPELVDGAPASVRSDVYAMGMTIYAALARLPYLRDNPLETLRAILMDAVAAPSLVRADIPPEIDAIVLRACARRPEERYASAQELQLALEEWLARQPPVDVGAWVRALLGKTLADKPMPHGVLTRTVPIFETSL
jgi:hypothetical protein